MKLRLAKPMNSRERVLAALRREPVDRTPVCNPTSVVTVALMDLVDAPFPEAHRIPELMARLGATSYTELGFDTIRFLREIHSEFVQRLPVPLILHICGRTMDRMEYIARTGLAAFHFDSKNDAAESMRVMGNRVALVGNINAPNTLYAQGPAEVRAEVFRALEAGVPLIGPECAIPLRTPIQNLKEIPRAVRAWHREHTASN